VFGGRFYAVDVPEVLPLIEVVANSLEIALLSEDGTELFNADIDATFYTKPSLMGLTAYDKFADVLVRDVRVFAGDEVQQASTADIAGAEYLFSSLFEAYADDPLNEQLIVPPVVEFNTRDLQQIQVTSDFNLDIADALVQNDGLTSLLPIEFGVILRAFKIDEGGDYLSFGLDIVAKDARNQEFEPGDNNACSNVVPSNPRYVAAMCLR
jgi:hypothetical protein